MAKKTIIANWKMNPLTLKEAEKLFRGLAGEALPLKRTEVVVCPPFIYLEKLKKLSRKVMLGAQDAFYGDTGAFTGEVSGEMLYGLGVRYTIIGHSERRGRGESNEEVNKKTKGALSAGVRPVVCVGETVRDENHEYFNVIKTQVEEALKGIFKNSLSNILIAYEPVWAISTTVGHKDATAGDSQEISIFIRKILSDKFGKEAGDVKILYGGSVSEKTAEEFMRDGGVEGLLVGKASLDVKKFTKIVKICETLEK